MERIAVAGAIAHRPQIGGHAWVMLQYLLGLRSLGYEVLFIDRLEPEMVTDSTGRPSDSAKAACIQWFEEVVGWAGLGDSATLLLEGGRKTVGLPVEVAAERLAGSRLLLNVMGFLPDGAPFEEQPTRVFLDIDPGFGQMWQALGQHDPFAGHEAFVTIGENIGRPGCSVPTCGLPWIASPQPVVLDLWPPTPGGEAFTSVATWRGPYDPVDYRGTRYGLRAHEFRRFSELPNRCGGRFELAVDIDPADRPDIEMLRSGGWRLLSPRDVAGELEAYRSFIQSSRAELMVAKGIYVQTNSGWVSDRSICYLASGKPVLAQETGLAGNYPVGEGLVTFRDLDEAVAKVSDIRRDEARHSRAARALAEEYFDSNRVLSTLIGKLT